MFGDQSLSKVQVVVVVISAPKKAAQKARTTAQGLCYCHTAQSSLCSGSCPKMKASLDFTCSFSSFRLHQDDWSGCGSSQE